MTDSNWADFFITLGSTDRWQRYRFEERKAARDRQRDEEFRHAASVANRGQFAMWIQSVEGQQYEKWARFAKLASEDIDDRVDAWEMAWQVEFEEAKDERQEVLDIYVRQNMEPAIRRDTSSDMKRFWPLFIGGLVGFVLLIVAALLSPGGISGSPLEWLAFLGLGLWGISGGASILVLVYAAGTRGQERQEEEARREKLEVEFSQVCPPRYTDFEAPSWHASMSMEELKERSRRIRRMVEQAHETFPRGDKLLHLSGTYKSNPDLDSDDLPAAVGMLLQGFRAEDAVREGELQGAQLP